MTIEIKLDKLPGHAKKGLLGEIFIKKGDQINDSTVLCTVESDKGTIDITSNYIGIITSLIASVGDSVVIGTPLFSLDGEAVLSEPEKTVGFSYSVGPAKAVDRELDFDLAILGAGPGGYVSAIYAAKKGLKTVLIEKDSPGGTCLNRGCIPTKTLIRSSEVFKLIKNAEKFGLTASHGPVNMKALVKRKNNTVTQLQQGISYLLEKNGVTYLNGRGELIGEGNLLVKEKFYNTRINAKDIILATGSDSCDLPIPGMNLPDILTSTDALNLDELPARLAIVGGGIIGMEFAFLFSNLGVEVTVFEYFDTILSVFDKDISLTLTLSAEKCGINLKTGTQVNEFLKNETGGCIISYEKNKKTQYSIFEKVLVAVGRKPCFDGLELKKNGLQLNAKKNGLFVDGFLKTSCDHIYAIGDLTGIIQLAHVASHQGITAVEAILGGEEEISYDFVPNAVFTDPEFSTIGLSEKEAESKGIEIKIGKFPFNASGKALSIGETDGFVKLLTNVNTGKIIGATAVGPHATDLLGELTLAVKSGMTPEFLAETIHAHPTLSEAVHEAAFDSLIGAIHL